MPLPTAEAASERVVQMQKDGLLPVMDTKPQPSFWLNSFPHPGDMNSRGDYKYSATFGWVRSSKT